jgi:outer membrane receptor protein involved in Fe transport
MKVQVVTAQRIRQPVGHVPASILVITREEIERYGYTRLDEILREIPGLFPINDYGHAAPGFGVRGYWSGEVNRNLIILVNGVSQVYDFNSIYPLWLIPVPVTSIERIEVVRGPMSVIYGSGALFGVVNIITTGLSSSEQGPTVVSAGVGNRETVMVSGRVAGSARQDRLQYVFDASLYKTDGIDQPYRKLSRQPFPPEWGISWDESTDGTLSQNERYAHLAVSTHGLTLDLSYAETRSGEHFVLPSYGHDDANQSRRQAMRVSLLYQRELSDRWTITARLGYFDTEFDAEYEYLFSGFEGTEQISTRAWEVELDCALKLSDSLDLTLGLSNRTVLEVEDFYDLPSFGDPSLFEVTEKLDDDQIRTQDAYTELHYEPTDRLRLVAGIRVDNLSGYDLAQLRRSPEAAIRGRYAGGDSQAVARAAAIYELGSNNVVKLLFGEAINRPSWFQNMKNFLDIEHGPLESERIRTYELNLVSTSLPGCTLGASLFRNELDNLITRISEVDPDGNYQSWFSNAGAIVTHGFEATAQLSPAPDWMLELSATWQQSDDKRLGYEEIEVAYSPEILGYLKTSYSVSDRTTIALTGTYVGAMYPYWDAARPAADGTLGARIGDRAPGYLLLNGSVLIKAALFKRWDLHLKGTNLLDEEIRYPTASSNDWADRGTMDRRRAFLLTSRRRF